jgi:hypothetical protein
MSERKKRPSRWAYAVAALIPVLGCLIAMVMTYQWFPGLPGTFESRMNLDNLTQVIVPGSEEITFAESGAYAVYYEYRSVVDGVVYASSQTPPALICSLTSKTTGADIGVAPDYVPTNSYSTKDRERVGVLIRSITIDEPGTYTFSCRYAGDKSEPAVVLAVGPNFVWEFFGIAARTVVTTAAGLAVLVGSGAVAAVVVIVTAAKRRRGSAVALVACLPLAALLLMSSGCGPLPLEGNRDTPACPPAAMRTSATAPSSRSRGATGSSSPGTTTTSIATAPTGSTRGATPATPPSTLASATTSSRASTRRGSPTTPTGCRKPR